MGKTYVTKPGAAQVAREQREASSKIQSQSRTASPGIPMQPLRPMNAQESDAPMFPAGTDFIKDTEVYDRASTSANSTLDAALQQTPQSQIQAQPQPQVQPQAQPQTQPQPQPQSPAQREEPNLISRPSTGQRRMSFV